MNKQKLLCAFFIGLIFLIIGCSDNKTENPKVLTGADILISEKIDILKGKNIAIVTNHTGVLSDGTHIVDTLSSFKDIRVKVLFGPEHGIRGDAPDGLSIKDGIDSNTGIPVFSLYGKTRKPTAKMLDDIDFILFDIQDVGARFYTFISTLYYVIEAASENDIPLIVLDRPNPIGGLKVDGPLRTEEYKSFVAIAPIPIMHGMTIGELAVMFNEEKYITSKDKADIRIIKMKNWKREYYYDDCRIPWIKPSPNMVSLNTAIIYPGLCLLEGTNVSEGRGTFDPFIIFGAPYINSAELISDLTNKYSQGLKFSAIEFIPEEIPNMSKYPKYKSKKCQGIKIEIVDRLAFNPVQFGISLVNSVYRLYPKYFQFRKNRIDKLFGNNYLKLMVQNNSHLDEIIFMWDTELNNFNLLRKNYLIY